MASTAIESGAGREHTTHGVSVTDVLLLVMALVWGLNFIVVKFGTGLVAPLAYNSARTLLALAILWTIVAIRGTTLPNRKDIKSLVALGVLGNGLYQIFWIIGVSLTRASDAALLVAASPAFIEIIGALRGHERAKFRALAGIGLSLVGIGLVVSGGAG